MREPILVINAGASSRKFSVFETAADRSLEAGVHGQVEGIGTSPRLKIANAQGRSVADQTAAGNDHRAAIAAIQDWFTDHVGGEAGFGGVGDRIVHGGTAYSEPVVIDDPVMSGLQALVPLAPLTQPHHTAPIAAVPDAAPE